MDPLDDLPKRSASHELDDAAQRVFESALLSDVFTIQARDRRDYGTDYQIEALRDGQATNLRIHVQLKGTDRDQNSGGTVSVAVKRANLNYLLVQPSSIYVCLHRPSGRLLARYATDVFQEYERRGREWHSQDTITVVFAEPFGDAFQAKMSSRILASGRAARDDRLQWLTTPPKQLAESLPNAVPRIEVPTDATGTEEVLRSLYEERQDRVISRNFDAFAAVLGEEAIGFLPAYMAEINLGINGLPIDKNRVRTGIDTLRAAESSEKYHRGSLRYSQGNGWLALEEYERAQETYLAALVELDDHHLNGVQARCCKNLGTVMQHLGDQAAATALYERALELEPDLPQARFALALARLMSGEDLEAALEHFDRAMTSGGRSKIPPAAVNGWKIEALFRLGRHGEAFGLVNTLVPEAKGSGWIWPWLARQVAAHGRSSTDSTKKALNFWRAYISAHPENVAARRELFLCHFVLHMAGVESGVDFDTFRELALELVDDGVEDPAFLWDRVGHWAQKDDDWSQAEEAFRTAWELEPSRYGYCLGTALNFLGRFHEALPILQAETESLQPDAMSWFQVGVAHDGLKAWSEAIEAFEHALSLNDDYALAWFNLGGAYWNGGEVLDALDVWRRAVARFPDHELASQVRDHFLGDAPRSTRDGEV